jgi:hypothetical protein
VQQSIGFFSRKLQHPLGFRAKWDFNRRRHLLAEDRAAFDFLPDVFEREMRSGEYAGGQPLAFPNQTKEQMLGFNGNAAELAGLVSCEEEDSSGSFGIPFEHPGYLGES